MWFQSEVGECVSVAAVSPAAFHAASELCIPVGFTITPPSPEQTPARDALHTTLFWGNQLCEWVQAGSVGTVVKADALGQRRKKKEKICHDSESTVTNYRPRSSTPCLLRELRVSASENNTITKLAAEEFQGIFLQVWVSRHCSQCNTIQETIWTTRRTFSSGVSESKGHFGWLRVERWSIIDWAAVCFVFSLFEKFDTIMKWKKCVACSVGQLGSGSQFQTSVQWRKSWFESAVKFKKEAKKELLKKFCRHIVHCTVLV